MSLTPQTIQQINDLASEMAAIFSPPELTVGCEVLSVADKDQYATNNGWIEARVGRHNQQRCRWRGQFPNVQVGDYVDVLYFVSYRLFVVFGQGGTAAAHQTQAAEVTVDTANFDKNLSAADDTVQKSLETIDELVTGGWVFDHIKTVSPTNTGAQFSDIQAAIDDAETAAGDVILLDPVAYNPADTILVNKAVTILCLDPYGATINFSANNKPAVKLAAVGAKLVNIGIIHSGAGTTAAAIELAANGTVLENCIATQNGAADNGFGVFVSAGTEWEIRNCQFFESGGVILKAGFYNMSGANGAIYGGLFSGDGDDINIVAGSTVELHNLPTLTNNRFTLAGTGKGAYQDNAGNIVLIGSSLLSGLDKAKVSKLAASDGSPDPAFSADAAGNVTGVGTIQGTRLISTIATGTAPLQVSSTTEVANLNAARLQGNAASAFATAANLNAHTGASAAVHGLPANVHVVGHRAGAGRFFQSAAGGNLTTTNNLPAMVYTVGVGTPTFPVAFSSTPVVITSSASSVWAGANSYNVTTTGFSWQGWSYAASLTCTLAYIALGT